MAAIQALQQWCKKQCEGYKDVNITNMTTSFRDGLAFCAILHRHRPDLINFSALRKENVYENNKLAFQIAEDELGIPALLDAEDMVALKVPDRLSILTYVSQYYNYFHGRSPIGGMSGIKRPPSTPNEEPTGKKVVTEPATPSPPKPSPVHVLSEAKTNPATRGKENAPVAARRHVLAESTNTLNSNCAVCGTHVHLVQRLLVDGKLYHRNCFRCRQCSRTLQSGNYKAGNDPGSLVCNRHEHPTPPQNSLPVCARDTVGENNLTGMTPSSGNSKGLELKKQAEESIKTIQAPKSNGVVKTPAGNPLDFGTNKAHSVTANLSSWWSDPVRNNSNIQNSLPVSVRATGGENNPINTTPSASYLNVFKKQAEEPIKTIHVPKSSGVVKTPAGDPSDVGMNKALSVTVNLRSQWSDPVKNTSDHRESPAASHSSPPSQWTASSSKMQEARTKFFQSGVGNSSSPGNKTEGVKNQGVPLNSSRVAGESPVPPPRGLGSNSDSSQKDRARNILMHALPGSQLSTNKTGNISTSPPASNFKPPPPSSALRHFEVKNVLPSEISRSAGMPSAPDKPNRAALQTPPEVDHFPKDLGHKGNTRTAAQNRFKEPINQAVDPGPKLDVKTTKAEGAEEKSETPADWRAMLKPVPNKPSGQGETRTFGKSADIHKVTINVPLNPTQDDKKPPSSAMALAGQTVGTDEPAKPIRTRDGVVLPSSQPQKKKLLVPQLEISGGWEKAKHSWQDSPVSQKSEMPKRIPEKTVASVKPSAPRTVQNPAGSRTRASPKSHPDYIPEAEIQKEVRQIEKDLDKLELKGVDMEKALRRCEGDDSEDALMVEWFKLIHEKQLLLRRESELMHKQNQQKLEEKQWSIETELRSLMSKSEFLKTPKERAREDELLKLYVATVDDRNKIIEDLDEDRLREMEEDEMLAAMIQKLDAHAPRNSPENDKKKTKSPFFRLMRMKN